MKCLSLGSKILCFDGSSKNIEDLQINDILMGTDSKSVKIINIKKHVKNLIKINPVKGKSITVSDDHNITLIGTIKKEQNTLYKNTITEYISRYSSYPNISKQWKLLTSDLIEFKSDDILPYDPYLIGLWIGDGTRYQSVISSMDKEIINYCINIGEKYGLQVRTIPYREPNKALKIQFKVNNCKSIKNSIIKPNYFRRYLKSNCLLDGIKNIPIEYIFSSKENRLKLLAGLIDTDGTYSEKGKCFSITTVDKNLAEQYYFLVKSLGYASYIKTKIAKITSINYETLAYNIVILGAVEDIPTLLPRKQASKRNQIKRFNVNGFTIEYIGEGECIELVLENNSLVLLDDFTII